MSDRPLPEPRRVLLIGATGLIGREVMRQAVTTPQVRLTALARREVPLPRGARMEMLVADTANWAQAIATIQPDAIICALGTTFAAVGKDEAAFRAVDQDLVLAVARAARAAGVERFVLISSVGAAISAKAFYLRVKGEVEQALGKLGFRRLDLLQPGLLRGKRAERRVLERVAMIVSPLTDLLLQGQWRRFRSVPAATLARAALAATLEKPGGRLTHDHDAILRLARKLDQPE